MDTSAAYDNSSAIPFTGVSTVQPKEVFDIADASGAPPKLQPPEPTQSGPSPGIAIHGNAPAPQQDTSKLDLSEWEPVQQNNQPQQTNNLDLSEWEPVPQPEKTLGSIASGVGAKIMNRLGEQGADQEKFVNDQITAPELALNTAGKTVAGSVNDIIGGVIEAGAHEVPDSVKKIAEAAGNAILNTEAGKAGVAAIQAGGKDWQDFSQNNPRTARSLEAIINIGGLIGVGGGVKAGAEATAQAGKETLDTAGKALVETAAGEYAQRAPEPGIKSTISSGSKAFEDSRYDIPAFERRGAAEAPTMDSKVQDYSQVPSTGVKQPEVADDATTSQFIKAQQQLDALNKRNAAVGEPRDAAGLAEKQQLEARVNELREQVLGKNTNAAFGQAKPVETAPDKTIEALKPEPEAPTPTPAATDTTKAADEAPTEPLEDNSKALKKESSAYYDKVMQSKEPLPADFTGKMLDSLRSNSAGNAIGDVKDADNPVNQLMDRYEKGGLRNQRITMGDVKTVDEKLGDIISSNLKDDGSPTALGHQAWEAQDKLREMAAQAPGGQDLQDARKYYQQGSKLRDLERIQEKADLTKNPATSIQSGIRTLLTSKRGRGYDADEVKALNKAAKDGIMGGALHLLGNRLIPAAAGIAEGLSGGITGGAATAAVTGVGGALARKGATAIKTSRLNKAKDVIVNKAPNGLLSKAKK